MIMGGGVGSGGSSRIKYLFVDGACLRKILEHTSERFFGGDPIQVDYHRLAHGFQKVFYYDSLAPRKSNETREHHEERIQPQVEFFNSLRRIDGYHVFEGITRRRRGVARQKKVDIMIAVDMLMHSFSRNMNRATLLASDLDFKPLLDALVQAGMHVTLWYEPGRTNDELLYSADARRPFNVSFLYDYTTAEFRQSHSKPRILHTPERQADGCILIGSGSTESGITVEVYRQEEGFSIVFPKQRSVGAYTRAEFEDLDFLKHFVEDVFFEYETITWS